jgi:hypothetical protein
MLQYAGRLFNVLAKRTQKKQGDPKIALSA